jgi:hypothetical protein
MASGSAEYLRGQAISPPPVRGGLGVAELVDGAFADVSGAIRPDWSLARTS